VLLLWIAALPAVEGKAQPLRAVIDSLGRDLVAGHPGGAVIGVVADGEQMVVGFGATDPSGTPPTAQTLFEIGSVTKTFTGLLLADAIERGTIGADDPVAQYLPDSLNIPALEGEPSTLVQLVTHRSGLPRIPSNLLPPANPADPYAHYTVADLYAFLEGYQPSSPSDSAYAYSNLGMGLLGHALARRADTSYTALVQQRIAGPLGLDDTRIDLAPAQQERFAQGYNPAGAPTPPWHIPTLAGAGALRSTTADMLTYVHAHLTAADATRLGRAMQRATTPIASADLGDNAAFARTRIGYAWHVTPRDGQTVVWHNGGTGGFSSFVGFNRDAGQGVVILTSMGGIASQVTSAGFTLLERFSTASG
jgi:CubicO group peptidase (beta-lactamase class C family)